MAYKSPGSRKQDAMDSLTCISILQHVLYGVMKVGGLGVLPQKKIFKCLKWCIFMHFGRE